MVTMHEPMKRNRPVRGRALIDWLIANGLVENSTDPVYRVLIDIKADEVVRVYVERYGTERMLEVVPPHLEPSQIREVDRPPHPPPPPPPYQPNDSLIGYMEQGQRGG